MILPYIFSIFLNFQPNIQDYKNIDFDAPMKIPMILAGNFGELRANHFHTGIDIKTQGKEGFGIYSIDEGYISRINFSHWGYGLALYVTHPNGLTSVYAHLSNVNDDIGKFLEKAQYQNQTETIDLYPTENQLKVKKGDFIAYSGNSGSSGGPHLHFEIRETNSEKPLNPLLFNFNIKDDVKPTIKAIRIYSDDLEYKKAYSVKGNKGIYEISDLISVPELTGIGIQTFDQLSGAGNHCGVYSIKLFLDDEMMYHQEMDFLDFSTNRYINNHMDYEEFTKSKTGVHRCFIHGHNELPIYKMLKGNGVIKIKDNEIHFVKAIVKDAHGNSSLLKFRIKKDEKLTPSKKKNISNFEFIHYFDTTEFSAFFPIRSMYNHFEIKYSREKSTNYLSDIHYLKGYLTPVQKNITISIDASKRKNIDSSKLLICYLDENGRLSSLGGKFDNNKIKAETKRLGKFVLYMDSIAPSIVNLNKDSVFDENSTIDYRITDNLSGIETYGITVDGVWLLANYIRKSAKLQLNVKKLKIPKGFHEINVKVVDERGNSSLYSHKVKIE